MNAIDVADPKKEQRLQAAEIMELPQLGLRSYIRGMYKLYTRSFGKIVTATAIISSPLWAISAMQAAFLSMNLLGGSAWTAFHFLTAPLSYVIPYIIPSLMALMISLHVMNRPVDVWECLDTAYRKSMLILSSAFAAAITQFICIGLFMTPFLLVFFSNETIIANSGLVLSATILLSGLSTALITAAVSLTPIVAVLEDKGWFRAVKRSLRLTCSSFPRFLKVSWFSLKAVISVLALGAAISLPASAIGNLIHYSIGSSTISYLLGHAGSLFYSLLLGPAFSAIPVYLYFELVRDDAMQQLSIEDPGNRAPDLLSDAADA